MALLTESVLAQKAEALFQRDRRYATVEKSQLAKAILTESAEAFNALMSYDIFLSHSYIDRIHILGLKAVIEESGHSVYIDWIEDKQLDRNLISEKTAGVLRFRMNSCRALFFATSANSTQSKWMPWECGYMDAKSQKVAICPILRTDQAGFKGQEYLGLYPFVDYANAQGSAKTSLWINDPQDSKVYTSLENWLNNGKLTRH